MYGLRIPEIGLSIKFACLKEGWDLGACDLVSLAYHASYRPVDRSGYGE